MHHAKTYHTAPDTHARHKDLLLFTFGLRKCCGDLSSASAAQGVTNSDGTTDRIDIFERNMKVLDGHDRLRCEGLITARQEVGRLPSTEKTHFVDLKEVDIILGYASLLKNFGDSKRGANTVTGVSEQTYHLIFQLTP